jgi:hypothetical protein
MGSSPAVRHSGECCDSVHLGEPGLLLFPVQQVIAFLPSVGNLAISFFDGWLEAL